MKAWFLMPALLSGLLLVSCNQNGSTSGPWRGGEVTFSRTGVSLTVGQDWLRLEREEAPPICTPTLMGPNGIIQAMLFDELDPSSDTSVAANELKAQLSGKMEAAKETFDQKPFVTAGGVKGMEVIYHAQPTNTGKVPEMESQNYLFKNNQGRWVNISYITSADADSEAVRRMILKTLKVQ